MKSKLLPLLTVTIFAPSLAVAAPHGGGAPAAPTRSAPPVAHGAPSSMNHWNGDWHHRRFRDAVFFDTFGFPFYPYWYWGYPYPYYDPYGYYSGYYNEPVYGQPYYGVSRSIVVQVQQGLAQAGYYHDAIDGVIGPRTRSAIRAFQRSHGIPVDGRINRHLLATIDRY